MADLSQFIQALYPDRGTPDEPRIMTPESANRPTGRSQQEVDDAFPLLLRAMAAAQQHMVPPMGGSASPIMRGARRPPSDPGRGRGPNQGPVSNDWEITREVSPLKFPAGTMGPPPQSSGPPNRSAPTIAETDPFRKIVAAKLAQQGGQDQKVVADPEYARGRDKGQYLDYVGGSYPHQDEPGSFKYITKPETELQKELWRGRFPPNDPLFTDYPKWHYEPGSDLDKRVIGRAMGTSSDAALGNGYMVGDHGEGPVRPGAPWAAGQQINKDLLWGPAPTFQGTQWKGTKEDLAKLIEQQKRIGINPPIIFPDSPD